MGKKHTDTVPSSYDEAGEPGEVETRCPYPRCHRILFTGPLGPGTNMEIMCPKCKQYLRLRVIKPE